MELDEFLAHATTDGSRFHELNDVDEFIVSSGAMRGPVTTSSHSTQHQVERGSGSVRSCDRRDLSARSLMADPEAVSIKGFRPIVPAGSAHLAKGDINKLKRYNIFLKYAANFLQH